MRSSLVSLTIWKVKVIHLIRIQLIDLTMEKDIPDIKIKS